MPVCFEKKILKRVFMIYKYRFNICKYIDGLTNNIVRGGMVGTVSERDRERDRESERECKPILGMNKLSLFVR